jgi:hypothetical protein
MTIFFCPRIFRANDSLGPCRDITVRFTAPTDPSIPLPGWNARTDLETVPPDHLGDDKYVLQFPSSTVIKSVKNFQLRESVSKRMVFSFHKEDRHVYRVFWDPEVITRPIWVLCLGIASVERKICTQ